MHTLCPRCQAVVVQTQNREGPNFCPHCHVLFRVPDVQLPPWILGVLTILMANWQILCHR